MKTRPSPSRSLAFLFALSACGAAPDLQAAVLGAVPEALEQRGSQGGEVPVVPAECLGLRDQINELDEAIAVHPDVRAVRDAYDASELGQRERAAVRAMSAEGCLASEDADLSTRCIALMEEIETCASTFENSPGFKRVQALPEVVAFEALSERFADLCAADMPNIDGDGVECPWTCEEGESADAEDIEDDACEASEDDASLPGTV